MIARKYGLIRKAFKENMDHDHYPDTLLRKILSDTKTIAMVGASANWNRPSFFAMKYLQSKGYRVIPVNPREAGTNILGELAYAQLKDIPDKVDMVDIFRNSKAAGPITDEAIDIGVPVIWMQLGVRNEDAAKRAEEAGTIVIMNRCPKIEYGRLNSELSWSGINSGVISSKRTKKAGGPIRRGGFSSRR
tara:strand:- start:167 stop:736 length:570 start_codon:yes stop_codon:yes gene_type:complete